MMSFRLLASSLLKEALQDKPCGTARRYRGSAQPEHSDLTSSPELSAERWSARSASQARQKKEFGISSHVFNYIY